MIEADTINELPLAYHSDVLQALAIVFASGVTAAQIEKEKRRIIDGNADESIEEAAKTLLESRRRIQTLQQFNHTCQQAYEKVNRNA